MSGVLEEVGRGVWVRVRVWGRREKGKSERVCGKGGRKRHFLRAEDGRGGLWHDAGWAAGTVSYVGTEWGQVCGSGAGCKKRVSGLDLLLRRKVYRLFSRLRLCVLYVRLDVR